MSRLDSGAVWGWGTLLGGLAVVAWRCWWSGPWPSDQRFSALPLSHHIPTSTDNSSGLFGLYRLEFKLRCLPLSCQTANIREKQRERNQDSAYGESWLFFGCRHEDRDFIFREELERFVANGTLSHLQVCFSRAELNTDGSEPKPKYVQHSLVLYAKHVARILLKENGCLYVCGDAKNMAKDVNDTLMDIIAAELQLDKLESMKTTAKLREEKRYLQDIWS